MLYLLLSTSLIGTFTLLEWCTNLTNAATRLSFRFSSAIEWPHLAHVLKAKEQITSSNISVLLNSEKQWV